MVEFFNKVKWLHLFVGLIIAFSVAFLLSDLLLHVKGKIFEYLFETGRVEFTNETDLQARVDMFDSAVYWLPLHVINAGIVAAVSTFYVVKRSLGAEFENGLALGVINSICIYQLSLLLSFTCVGVSVYISYKRKGSQEP